MESSEVGACLVERALYRDGVSPQAPMSRLDSPNSAEGKKNLPETGRTVSGRLCPWCLGLACRITCVHLGMPIGILIIWACFLSPVPCLIPHALQLDPRLLAPQGHRAALGLGTWCLLECHTHS